MHYEQVNCTYLQHTAFLICLMAEAAKGVADDPRKCDRMWRVYLLLRDALSLSHGDCNVSGVPLAVDKSYNSTINHKA